MFVKIGRYRIRDTAKLGRGRGFEIRSRFFKSIRFWVIIAVALISSVNITVSALTAVEPRNVLTSELLKLANRYHKDYTAVIKYRISGTETLTVDLLRASGYDVRKFEKYNCDGKFTNIIILVHENGGYSVMNYNLKCWGI